MAENAVGMWRCGLMLALTLVSLSACAALPAEKPSNPLVRGALSAIHGFQDVISPVDGDRCQMRPSCSAYAEDAMKKHGFFIGWIMTCDRLMRCGQDELHRGDVRVLGVKPYCFDPVSNNDFWWDGGEP